MAGNATLSYRENQYPFVFQVVTDWSELYLLPRVMGKAWHWLQGREEESGHHLIGIDGEFLSQTPIFYLLRQSVTFSSGGQS